MIDEHLTDSRRGSKKEFSLADLVRQSVDSRLAGYEELNDAVRAFADPTFRLISSKENWDRGGALTSRRQSFEAVLPASEENLLGLTAAQGHLNHQPFGEMLNRLAVLPVPGGQQSIRGATKWVLAGR